LSCARSSCRLARALYWVLVVVPLLVASPDIAQAEGGDEDERARWSIGLLAGTYSPDTRKLDSILSTSGTVLLQDPNFLIPRNQDLSARQRDISVEGLAGDLSYGLEAQWQLLDRVSVVFMVLNWQGRVTQQDVITMSLRSNLPPVDVPRTARYNLNVSQLWLGWRYSLFESPGNGRLYANFGVAGLATADMTMDALLKVNEAETLGVNFASISSTEVRGKAYTSRYGLGGEYYLGDHVSVGFHANRVFGEVNEFDVARYFPSGFSEFPPLPPNSTNSLPDNVLPSNHAQPVPGEPLQYATIDEPREAVELVRNPRNLLLDLDGWDMGFFLRVYY